MLIAQSAMLVVATVLTGLTFAAITTPFVLLAATFLIAAGTALNAPSWQASMRSEEHTSELQSLMRISYAVFCLKKKKKSHIFIILTFISVYLLLVSFLHIPTSFLIFYLFIYYIIII